MDAALDRVGMKAFRKRQIGELSGGQKKRVFLARALAQDAGIILLDEPFTGVDVTTEEAIIALLRGLRDEGKVILVSTHNLGSASAGPAASPIARKASARSSGRASSSSTSDSTGSTVLRW